MLRSIGPLWYKLGMVYDTNYLLANTTDMYPRVESSTFQIINPYRRIAVDESLVTIVDKLHEASDLLSRIKRECGTCYLVPWDIDPIIAHINILIMEYEYRLTFLNN